ncbi:MAG: hypothetical protein D6740_04805 [Alphaproteobacteria bacterium]|nr:MAG: hypothetical protein D6740_04805 [Alphaproteobacteria bacterium]
MLQRIKTAIRLAGDGLFGRQTDFFDVMRLHGQLPDDEEAARIIALKVVPRAVPAAHRDLPRAA